MATLQNSFTVTQEMDLLIREEGGFDARSQAIRDGLVKFTPSGMPLGVGACIQKYAKAHGHRHRRWEEEADLREVQHYSRLAAHRRQRADASSSREDANVCPCDECAIM